MELKAKDRRLEGDTLLRQTQLTELYLLDVFVEICEKHGLRYFLDSGTLLGAMRHGGFIPWDDDIDVGMPLKDFKRFISIARNELPQNLLLQKPSFFFGRPETYAKLRDCSSFYCTDVTNVCEPSGIYIDIFPFYKFPAIAPGILTKLAKFSTFVRGQYDANIRAYSQGIFQLLHQTFAAIVWLCIGRSIILLVRVLELFSPCNWRYCIGFGTSLQNGVKFTDIFPLSTAKFEGKSYNAPNKPETLLEKYYSDWKKLPSVEDRVWHADIVCPTKAPKIWWAQKHKSETK